MTQQDTPAKPDSTAQREKRQAEALRANLQRRKAPVPPPSDQKPD